MTDAEYISVLEKELLKRERKIDKLEVENERLESKNEKLSIEVECLKRDNHIYLEAEAEYAEKPEEPVSKTVKGYTRKRPKAKRDEIIKNIETEIIEYTIPENEQVCERCKATMRVVGKKYIREEVELIHAKLVVKKYYSLTYG